LAPASAVSDGAVQDQFSRHDATIGTFSRWIFIMRLPIILALIVIITLPKDVRGFVDDVSAQARVATATISHFIGRDRGDTVQVADASNLLKTRHDTAKNSVADIR
jgi:hypothetical protein